MGVGSRIRRSRAKTGGEGANERVMADTMDFGMACCQRRGLLIMQCRERDIVGLGFRMRCTTRTDRLASKSSVH
jgi:hypothetical protein